MVTRLLSRSITAPVRRDLADEMVFIGGPRQVGKTTLALGLLGAEDERHPGYRNWDDSGTRLALLRGEIPAGQSLVVLDEIHKHRRWQSLVKGLYDTHHSRISFLVTGSARLDLYRKGGESLQGRYHAYRLHPVSLLELAPHPTRQDLDHLLAFGGFPEPLVARSERTWRRWHRERMERVVRQDVRDTDGREVDFVVLRERKPLFAVECKTGEKKISAAARYFRQRTTITEIYQVHTGERDFGNADTDVRVLPFRTFCVEKALP